MAVAVKSLNKVKMHFSLILYILEQLSLTIDSLFESFQHKMIFKFGSVLFYKSLNFASMIYK